MRWPLGSNYRRLFHADDTADRIIAISDWTPPDDHMVLLAGVEGARMSAVPIMNMGQLHNIVDWAARGETYRRMFLIQQFVLLFGICK